MQFKTPIILAYLATIGTAAPTPGVKNAMNQVKARTAPKEDFVDFYSGPPSADKRELPKYFVDFYSPEKRALPKEDFVDFYNGPLSVEKRASPKEDFVDFYSGSSGEDLDKRTAPKEDFVDFYSGSPE